MMGFSNREYHLYVVLGDANMPPLWHWSLWQRVSAELDPIIAAAAGPVGVRSTQKSIIDGSQIRFGKISWSSKGHMKWTHGSPETLGTPKDSNFLHTEIWAPSRTASDKRAMPPDFLLAFQNEGYWGASALAFNPYIIVAAATDMDEQWNRDVGAFVTQLSQMVNFKLRAYQLRPWGRSLAGGRAYTNGIGDLMTIPVFKPGKHHTAPPTLDILQEEWRPF